MHIFTILILSVIPYNFNRLLLKELIHIISYRPLWETMRRKKITQYQLLKLGIDNRTLNSLKHDKNITLFTMEKLCVILDCTPDEFHMKMYEITRNPFIIKISNITKDILNSALSFTVTKKGAEEGVEFHTQIIECIKARDAEKLRRITRESLKAIEDETFADNFKGEDTAEN